MTSIAPTSSLVKSPLIFSWNSQASLSLLSDRHINLSCCKLCEILSINQIHKLSFCVFNIYDVSERLIFDVNIAIILTIFWTCDHLDTHLMWTMGCLEKIRWTLRNKIITTVHFNWSSYFFNFLSVIEWFERSLILYLFLCFVIRISLQKCVGRQNVFVEIV